MGNKSKNKTMQWGIVALVVIAIAFASISFNVGDNADATTVQAIISSGANAEFCANNPALDGDVRIKDALASTKAYLNGTIYVKNLDTNSITSQTVTTGGTSAFTTFTDLFDCNSENGYEVYVKGTGNSNSDGITAVTPDMLSREPVEFTIDASQYEPFKVKAYDNVDRSKAKSTADNSTDYVASLTSTFQANTGAGFDSTVADALDITFTLQPNTTAQAKGNGMYIAINTEDSSNLADFDETLTSVWYNGVKLVEATGLPENDLRALNDYEHIFKVDDSIGLIGGVKSAQATLRVYLEPEADQTSKDFDPVIKIVALGDVESNEADEILRGVGFADDSSRTELYSAQTITISIV